MQKAGRVTKLRLQRAGTDASANYAGANASTNNKPFAQHGSLLATIAATVGKSEWCTLKAAEHR